MKYKSSYGKEIQGMLMKAAKSRKLLHRFLSDLLTPAEYKDLAIRWQIVKMLNKGIHHRQIAKKLKVSIATVTRGSKEMLDKNGGFKKLLGLK